MIDKIENRVGAIKAALIPQEVKEYLNKGLIETVNLTEWLEVDHKELLFHVLTNIGYDKFLSDCISGLEEQTKSGTLNDIKIIGKSLYQQSIDNNDKSLFNILSSHKSDSVRCWAAYYAVSNEKDSINTKLDRISAFAADKQFGVREIAWMAIRPDVDINLEESIQLLSLWTRNEDENIRRFASEVTRPRGVWCKHIDQLKNNPEQALSILESMRSDKSKYVQNSVANWLNDASKTSPDWVIELCQRWKSESDTKETKYIIKRALRSLNK